MAQVYNRQKVDAFLTKHSQLRRYASMHEAGFSYEALKIHYSEKELNSKTNYWKEKFIRTLSSKFKKPKRVRCSVGPYVNVFDALAGEPEFCSRLQHKAQDGVRIGINLSRTAESIELVAMRGGAILALWHMCKARGQRVHVEIAYGNGLTCGSYGLCHVRIGMPMPTVGQITSICCSHLAINVVGEGVIDQIPGCRWAGGYRFYEFAAAKFPHEYDFVLDRIETTCEATEEKRIVDQLTRIGLM